LVNTEWFLSVLIPSYHSRSSFPYTSIQSSYTHLRDYKWGGEGSAGHRCVNAGRIIIVLHCYFQTIQRLLVTYRAVEPGRSGHSRIEVRGRASSHGFPSTGDSQGILVGALLRLPVPFDSFYWWSGCDGEGGDRGTVSRRNVQNGP